MDDLSGTVETYERVADRYRERHADRAVVADLVERFLDALDARGTSGDGSASGTGSGSKTGRRNGSGTESGTREPPARPVVLDAGCGPGWETATFAAAGCTVVVADLAPSFLAAAREQAPDAHVARMDMRRPAVRDGVLDGVWACASFLHVPRDEAGPAPSAFRRTLRAGGTLCPSVRRGDGEAPGRADEDDERRFVYWRADDVRDLARTAGFRDVAVDADGDWLQVLATV